MFQPNESPEAHEEEEEEEEIEEMVYEQMHQSQADDSEDISINTQQKALAEELKASRQALYDNDQYYNPDQLSSEKYRVVSEMESENDYVDYDITTIRERGVLIDKLPIRTGCFNGDYLAIGTNSKCLKIWNIANLVRSTEKDNELDEKYGNNYEHDLPLEEIQVIFDQLNHHEGSIYCIDWTECERLIATGSNDKKIKILVWPPLNEMDEGEESDNLLELTLIGHQAIVRSLCFHPKNELNLISGGEVDPYLRIWDTETGNNIYNLEGHPNGVFSVKPNFDGTYFVSVGKDAHLKVWDIRDQKCVYSLDCSEFGETTCVTLNSEVFNTPSKIAAVSHSSGIISLWDLNMRKWVNDVLAHDKEARSVSFSYDGKYLASGGFDSSIKIMDLTDEFKIVKVLEHTNKVISVKWHAQQPLLLSTSADKSARVWIPA